MVKNKPKVNDLLKHYKKAYDFVSENFPEDISWQNSVKFANITPKYFFEQYVWVVLVSGFKASIVQKIYEKWSKNPKKFSAIRHPLKKKAIKKTSENYRRLFNELKTKKTNSERLEYLVTLPHIGNITKYHLAKNLGIDVAKPDVHLERIMKKFGFDDVQEMCNVIKKKTRHKISVIDIVLWRYAEQRKS